MRLFFYLFRLEERIMSKCIERMIREYPVRKPIADPTSKQEEDKSDTGSIDNTLVGMNL